MSPLLSPYKVDIKTDALSGYDIDKISKVSTTTENGNRAEYSCTLTIPASIESTSSDYIYPIRIIYDGISILPIQQKVQAWRYNYFNVSIKKDEMTIDKDNQLLTFPYVINIEQRFSESDPYPMEVEIVPDTLFAKITKITDTQGLCSMPVSQLKEGENLVYIRLVEQGCPPIDFPFSFTYTKPSPKTKRKPVVKVKEPDYNLKFDL